MLNIVSSCVLKIVVYSYAYTLCVWLCLGNSFSLPLKSANERSMCVCVCVWMWLALLWFDRGAFSVVKKAVHKKTGQNFAAKIINTRRLTSRGRFSLSLSLLILPSFPTITYLTKLTVITTYPLPHSPTHSLTHTHTSPDLQKLEREARICRMMKHANIGKYMNSVTMDAGPGQSSLWSS